MQGEAQKRSRQKSPEKLYTVEKILDKRLFEGKKFYRVKWQGYPTAQATWEPVENLLTILDLIVDFEIRDTQNDDELKKEKDQKRPADQSLSDEEKEPEKKMKGEKTVTETHSNPKEKNKMIVNKKTIEKLSKSSKSPAEVVLKRKRGRPRKYARISHTEKTAQPKMTSEDLYQVDDEEEGINIVLIREEEELELELESEDVGLEIEKDQITFRDDKTQVITKQNNNNEAFVKARRQAVLSWKDSLISREDENNQFFPKERTPIKQKGMSQDEDETLRSNTTTATKAGRKSSDSIVNDDCSHDEDKKFNKIFIKEGSFQSKDKPKAILKTQILSGNNNYKFLVSWEVGSDGVRPEQSYVINQEFKNYDPLFLIEYYEKLIKHNLIKSGQYDQLTKYENEDIIQLEPIPEHFGSLAFHDKPKSIINIQKFYQMGCDFLVSWHERCCGEEPHDSVVNSESFKIHNPLFLIDYYETKLKPYHHDLILDIPEKFHQTEARFFIDESLKGESTIEQKNI